jgi:hypothetical protein
MFCQASFVVSALPSSALRGGSLNRQSCMLRVRPARPAAPACSRGSGVCGLRASASDDSMDAMRSRLEGLFGVTSGDDDLGRSLKFNGKALRKAIKDRFTVEVSLRIRSEGSLGLQFCAARSRSLSGRPAAKILSPNLGTERSPDICFYFLCD